MSDWHAAGIAGCPGRVFTDSHDPSQPRARRRRQPAACAVRDRATSFDLGTGSHPDVAVDGDGTAHVVVDLPDERLRYCRILRGETACSVDRTISPPAEAIGRSSFVFLPGPNRVVIVTHRCCSPDATLAYQSADNGATFGGPVRHRVRAVVALAPVKRGAFRNKKQRMRVT